MKKILFIVNNGKISPNENGGASVYYSHLELLFKMGYEITILSVQWGENDIYKSSDFTEVKHMVKDIVSYKSYMVLPTKGISRLYNAIFRPQNFEYFFLNWYNNKYLRNLVEELKTDLVWSEWRWAGIWATFANLAMPVVYAHHDWEYKLAKLRSKRTFFGRFHTFQKKRVEFKLVKGVEGCISGSVTETK